MNIFIFSIYVICHVASSPASATFHHQNLGLTSKLGTFLRVQPASISSTPSTSDSSPSFSQWSEWSICSSKCSQRRKRSCLTPYVCGKNVMIERRACPQTSSTDASGNAISCVPQRRHAPRRHQTFIKRLLSDIYDPAREEESTLTMEEFLYSDWSVWSRCSRSCHQRRSKECQFPLLCGRKMILEERSCFPEGTKCAEMKRNSHAYNR